VGFTGTDLAMGLWWRRAVDAGDVCKLLAP
jgi:hypothetical protein